jgi:hypothetical protein
MASTSVRLVSVPLRRPAQLEPPSAVCSSVPKSPAAYPLAPAKDIARRLLPCGTGLPHCQPDEPTCTLAGAPAGKAASSPTAPASAPTDRNRIIETSSSSGSRWGDNGSRERGVTPSYSGAWTSRALPTG